MEVKNNKTENPLAIYREKYKNADPEASAKRSRLDYKDGVFTMKLLNRTVFLKWPQITAEYEDGQKMSNTNLILCARYAMEGALIPSSGKMLAYSEMPWGPVYERQFRGRCMNRMAATYGHNLEGFKAACEAIGGRAVKGGDAAYDIELMSGLVMRFILWLPDDEFPANAQVVFSDNFPAAFTAEDMAVAGDVVLNAMKGRW